jgi:hypothetical protein
MNKYSVILVCLFASALTCNILKSNTCAQYNGISIVQDNDLFDLKVSNDLYMFLHVSECKNAESKYSQLASLYMFCYYNIKESLCNKTNIPDMQLPCYSTCKSMLDVMNCVDYNPIPAGMCNHFPETKTCLSSQASLVLHVTIAHLLALLLLVLGVLCL